MPTFSSQACFQCRKAFKKPHGYSLPLLIYRCPECGDTMLAMGYKFRPPRSNNKREWNRIQTAIKEGRDWMVPTVRKEKLKPELSPQLRIGLGIYGKRKAKNPGANK